MAAVSYLNTVPLVWGMMQGEQKDLFDLQYCVPSECADRLRNGTADIGIVPVVEVARQQLYHLPGSGIACRGPVRSVLLFSKVPPAEIRSFAADTSSRTSAMLTRVILSKRYDARPEVIPMAPDLGTMLTRADAALIIGDPALLLDPEKLPYHCLDLGEEWVEMTGFPMVFAVWAGRPEVLTDEVAEAFAASAEAGVAAIDQIAIEQAPIRGLTEAMTRRYLTRHTAFILDESDYHGMKLFLKYVAEIEA